MLQLYKLSKSYGSQRLFDKVSWKVSPGDRVGLTGPNGSGKTSLLRLVTGAETADEGELSMPREFTVGYLPQEGLVHHGRSVRDEALAAFDHLLALRAEQREIEKKLESIKESGPDHDSLLERYGECQEEWDRHQGFSIEARTEEVLIGLGFSTGDFGRPAETFSGGWQMRIALAKLLLSKPNMLLLDEPTNHLDIVARQWLEQYLTTYEHAIVLVSHDRMFLDRVVTRITEIDRRRLVDYMGNYSSFLKQREKRRAELIAKAAQQREEIEKIERFISRFRYKASKAAQVQSRVKMLEKMERIEVPPQRKLVKFRLPDPPRSGRIPIELKDLCKRYADVEVLDGVNLIVERGEKLSIVGPNGVGKSTLMRLLSGVEPPDSGERRIGHNTKLGYFGQDRFDLDLERTVLQNMTEAAPVELVPRLRTMLGAFLFTDDAVDKKVKVLSGGEKSRLALARMLLRPANLLLLDEPTNHLDLDSKEILLDALKAYKGTMVFVSHDRYFLDRLATNVAEIENKALVVHRGGFADYLRAKKRGRDIDPERTSPESPVRDKPEAPNKDTLRTTKETERLSKNREREMKAKLENLERDIEQTETAVDSLEARMAVPGFYDDAEASSEIVRTHQELQGRLETLYEEWEKLAAKQ